MPAIVARVHCKLPGAVPPQLVQRQKLLPVGVSAAVIPHKPCALRGLVVATTKNQIKLYRSGVCLASRGVSQSSQRPIIPGSSADQRVVRDGIGSPEIRRQVLLDSVKCSVGQLIFPSLIAGIGPVPTQCPRRGASHAQPQIPAGRIRSYGTVNIATPTAGKQI